MAKKNRKVLGAFQTEGLSNASKTLLANIRFASLDKPIKTIVVTSSVMDEGKSTVVGNLSCAIASSGKRVLVVDGDLRRRSLGAMLGMHNSNGLYSVLSGQASLRAAISATHIPNLFFLDCEPNVPNPADIFATKRFAVLMDKLSQTFDYVIFDMPPIGLFVDAAVASNLADGTLMVVRQGATPRDTIEKAIAQLRAADANILGLVMTFVREDSGGNYYYAYNNEEGKRVRKGDSDSPVVAEDPSAVLGALDDNNIESWARSTGVGTTRGQAQQQGQRPQRSHRAAGDQAAPQQQAPDAFAPGAFRSSGSGDQGDSGRARSRRSTR